MFSLVILIHALACILLILIVLIQQGKGGGLIGSLSSAESIFGTKTNTFLIKATSVLAVIFFFTCLSLAFFSIQQSKSLIETKYKPWQAGAQTGSAQAPAQTPAAAETKTSPQPETAAPATNPETAAKAANSAVVPTAPAPASPASQPASAQATQGGQTQQSASGQVESKNK